MNYRHAFHAGNFADVLKHAVLAWWVGYLQQKPQAIRIIESHAGAGLYDLGGEAAARTSEWREGVGRLAERFDERGEAFLAPYRRALAAFGWDGAQSRLYPGSPLIAAGMLRPADRYLGAERHGATAKLLVDALAERHPRDERIKVLARDGWETLRAALPPRERRGLVLIDPPFEAADEWTELSRALGDALQRWPTGAVLVWYPLKNPRQADELCAGVPGSGRREALRIELAVDDLATATKLAGCGLLAINPPWTLAAEMEHILPALAERLARGGSAGYRCERLT
jgi:23S rRNA (adenine2030-N6)-methyltransferase